MNVVHDCICVCVKRVWNNLEKNINKTKQTQKLYIWISIKLRATTMLWPQPLTQTTPKSRRALRTQRTLHLVIRLPKRARAGQPAEGRPARLTKQSFHISCVTNNYISHRILFPFFFRIKILLKPNYVVIWPLFHSIFCKTNLYPTATQKWDIENITFEFLKIETLKNTKKTKKKHKKMHYIK